MNKQWQKITVKPEDSITSVLQVIEKAASRFAMVADNEHTLLGVITDGDIRRHILKGLSLNEKASKIMTENCVTASPSTSKSELFTTMEKKGLLSIPIIRAGKIVGIETLYKVLETKTHQNPVIFMAGGFGTRLKPLTDNCPKPMLKVGDRPILETMISRCKKADFVNFYISTHYMPEVIKNHFGNGSDLGVNINYIHEDTPLGTAGALGLLPKNIPQLPTIVLNGDVLTNIDFERLIMFHNKHKATATMCVREYEYTVPYGVITGEGHNIKKMTEKPTYSFFVNAGIYVLSTKLIQEVEENRQIDMPTLLEKHIASKDEVLMFPIHEYWLDIGHIEEFKRAQVDIQTLELI